MLYSKKLYTSPSLNPYNHVCSTSPVTRRVRVETVNHGTPLRLRLSAACSLVIEHPLEPMRIDNAFSYMMERRAGSSKATGPPVYDAEDCHECVSSTSTIC
jgi:hypothetical protein